MQRLLGILLAVLICTGFAGAASRAFSDYRSREDSEALLRSQIVEIFKPATRNQISQLKTVIETFFDNLFGTIKETAPTATIPAPTNTQCGPRRECVKRTQCLNGTINTGGKYLINLRTSRNEGGCHYLMQCCHLDDKIPDTVEPTREKELRPGCGYRNPNGLAYTIDFAVNGEANFGEFPWMVALLYRNSDHLEYIGGGSLLTPYVVLTAAHKVVGKNAAKLVARAGEWDTSTEYEQYRHQDHDVREIVVHEQFNQDSAVNSIALVFLENHFKLAVHIQPICLPGAQEVFDYSSCYVTGWGTKSLNSTEFPNILKEISLPVVPRMECQDSLRKTRLGRLFQLDKSFICAGGEKDVDSCLGDGGSALACPIKGSTDRYYQAGIVAWGIDCGVKNLPGVYVSVSHQRPWIDQILKARNIDTSYYEA